MKKFIIVILIIGIILSVVEIKADTIAASNISMKDNSSTTIKSRLDALAVKYSNFTNPTACPSYAICHWKKSWSNVTEGDYVQMTPNPSGLDEQNRYKIEGTETGYYKNSTTKELVPQYIHPKELKLWRVIKVYNDGTIDLVSEYLSSEPIYFTGVTGYANFIGTLNTIAKQYENPTYTTGSRYMGYNGQTETIRNTAAFDGTGNSAPWTCTTGSLFSSCNPKPQDNEPLGGGDTLYSTDTNMVAAALGTLVAKKCNDTSCSNPTSENSYWIASRYYYYNKSTFYFRGRRMDNRGVFDDYGNMRYYNNSWKDNNNNGTGLRPIITLKSGLSVSDAVGSFRDPFILP